MKEHFQRATLAAMLALGPGLAQAHAGHGLPGASHWHASDVALLLAAVGVFGLWLARRK